MPLHQDRAGVNPPASIESEEASRPTGDDDGLRRRAASATEGLARFVAICETEEIASPQEGQKREPSGVSAGQLGQRITLHESYRKMPGNSLADRRLHVPEENGNVGAAGQPELPEGFFVFVSP
jgi:hypothetical protein